MIIARPTHNEKARLKALNKLDILNADIEDQYVNLTQLAAYVCKTKSSVISLVGKDRQWFKSRVCMDACETSRDLSFCAHAINNPDSIMVVNDATTDVRFSDNPLVTNKENPIRFYAGVPLVDSEGNALGTLCVIHDKPKKLDKKQLKALRNLAIQVQELFRIRSMNTELELSRRHLKKHNEMLRDFAGTVSHDMKMPLANLIVTSDILKKKYANLLDAAGKEYLGYLKTSSLSLSDYISNILNHYESSSHRGDDREEFYLNDVLEHIIEMVDIKHDCEINLPEENPLINCNKIALEQILLNLIVNSIKYNDKETTLININAQEDDDFYIIKVEDNGRGIPADKIDQIFDLFQTTGGVDRNGKKGHGIGLCTVSQLIEELGGTIKVESEEKKFCRFTFSISK